MLGSHFFKECIEAGKKARTQGLTKDDNPWHPIHESIWFDAWELGFEGKEG